MSYDNNYMNNFFDSSTSTSSSSESLPNSPLQTNSLFGDQRNNVQNQRNLSIIFSNSNNRGRFRNERSVRLGRNNLTQENSEENFSTPYTSDNEASEPRNPPRVNSNMSDPDYEITMPMLEQQASEEDSFLNLQTHFQELEQMRFRMLDHRSSSDEDQSIFSIERHSGLDQQISGQSSQSPKYEERPIRETKELFDGKGVKIYSRPSTLYHTQLRDLLRNSAVNPDLLYIPHNFGLCVYSQQSKDVRMYINCQYRITSLDCRDEMYAFGGYNSELVVCFSDNDRSETLPIGSLIINCVEILPNKRNIVLSNNDQNLYFLTIRENGTLPIEQKINLKMPINCSSLRPDSNGSVFALVGDKKMAKIIDIRANNKVTHILYGANDLSMHCDWDPNGLHLALASQEGAALVYDIRKPNQILAKIMSSQSHYQCNPVRNVKFSKEGRYLLVQEQKNVVKVVDAINYSEFQKVDIHQNGDLNIVGSCFSNDSNYFYIASLNYISKYQINLQNRFFLHSGEFK
ncbi:wd repeat protein [Anaeramoeba flamelloides]|uniref:Wd repeat protein n=1 Tax=Anaeramoeba flamelloides TaxID=1746091 RepID=A0AAV7ZRW6_9EUKA|nr:wd repeat protein [Anaeramoeba flamelloides]